jgi:hypothetical protein
MVGQPPIFLASSVRKELKRHVSKRLVQSSHNAKGYRRMPLPLRRRDPKILDSFWVQRRHVMRLPSPRLIQKLVQAWKETEAAGIVGVRSADSKSRFPGADCPSGGPDGNF